jgi:hypothetical protein
MMKDIMVDIETMDNVASAAIVSIGAVQCNLITGELGAEYYRVIDLDGQAEIGMSLNAETIYWWMDQSELAREALLIKGKISLDAMCGSFSKWILHLDPSGEKMRLWGNGASFDNAIIRYAFRQCGHSLHESVKFWNDRDMRTIVGFYPRQLQEKWRRSNYRAGTAHNALDDAMHQVKYCSAILTDLGVKELY